MRKIATHTFALLLAVGFSTQAHAAIIDDYSTGPGQGSPDGLDDIWQALYNGWGLSPAGDEDEDGCSNLVECVAGSNPRLQGDCFMIGNVAMNGNTIIMSFDSKQGKKYQVWESSTPAGAAPGEPGSQWAEVSGAFKVAGADGADTLAFTKPVGSRKFYRLETEDHDTDGDQLSDWAELKLGTDVNAAASSSNASGGVANDFDTMRSVLSLTMSVGSADAFEKEGTPATIRLRRQFGTMPLRLPISTEAGAVLPTKSSASGSDFIVRDYNNTATDIVTLPANEGLDTPYIVARITPVSDAAPEVPESLKVTLELPDVPPGTPNPTATINIKDADPAKPENKTLYVAFLGREAGAASTASGYATALVDGANNSASISVVFNNLSSDQNTAYIRIGPDLEIQVLPLGQVSGANWNIRAAQTEVTDQRMLEALANGQVYVAITTVNFPDKEIYGYFNRTTGSATFDEANPNLQAPELGSALWQAPTGDALEREIWRFLSQATFGGTTAIYNEVRAEVDAAIAGGGTYVDGLSAWMDKQMDPAQAPQINYRKLVEAADMEEFALRGNKPITYNNDPQLNGGSIGVSFVNGMPVASASNPNTNDPGNNYPRDAPNRRREWWTMITQSKDHLRQRVAQALSEICVISERDATVLAWHYGAANWWDMLAAGAFGKYRPLLEQVSLNPMMGVYLTSVANRAAYDAGGGLIVSPDENYAREIMQLFSIGLVLRHPDGSLQLSSEGLPIATYDNNDITELARVFTGFSHGARHGTVRASVQQGYGGVTTTDQRISPTVFPNGSTNNIWFGRQDGHLYWQAPWIYPMKVIGRIGTTVYHDFNTYSYLDVTQTPPVQVVVPGVSKRLLAGKHGQYEIPTWDPAGKTDADTHTRAALEVSMAHDVLAGRSADSSYGAGTQSSPGHTNTPINMSRWLIQRLVTSNPSAGYIYRVQKVWRDTNGTLGPVIKAILLDYEARSLQLADSSISYGKVKEPLIHFANILRQFRAYSGAPVSILRDMNLPFSETDAPSGSYPTDEYAKFDTANANPPSKPNGWSDGPFRLRLDSLRGNLGQSPLDAPSVFNWFYPDFTVPGNMAQAGLVAPEMQTVTEGAEITKINFLYSYMWMTLAHMATQPGTGTSVADFIFRNGWATPAVRFSTNGGANFLGWPASITLNDTNWNTGVTVTMVGVNNQQFSQMAGTQVRYAVSGSAPGYSGVTTLPTDLSFVENEAKNEQLVISQTGGNTWVQEGGATDAISVKLSAPPATGSSVNVALVPQNGDAAVSPATLVFTDADWNTPQTVTITAVDDADAEDAGLGNELVQFTVTSATSANYHGIPVPALTVSVTDNDNGYGVLISQTGGTTDVMETGNTTVGQAGIDSYTIVLTRAPSANVVVTCTSNGQLGINTTGTTFTTSSTTRTFTTGNWNVPQTVIVRGNNDTTGENTHSGTVTHTIAAVTTGYPTTMPIQQVVASIADDDNSIIVTPTDGETRVMEGNDPLIADTVTVRLRSNPNAQVSVTLSSSQLKFSPSTLVFEPTSVGGSSLWSIDKTVTVRANDDYINEGLHTTTITAYSQSAGSNYNGSTGGTALPVTVIDNDDARVVVTQSDGGTVVNEDGTTDSYTLTLGRKPKPGTTITVTTSGYSGITLTPAGPFTFDEANWNTPQTILVNASNDGTAEPVAVTNITHSVVSSDPTYHNSSTPVVTVTIGDNEPALAVTQTNIFTQVKEGGSAGTGGTPNASDTFTVAPARTPATGSTVTVTLVPNAQVTVSPSVLSFTTTAAQTVTVTAVDDAEAEPASHQGVIGFNITSTDSYFNGAATPPVMVQVTDNDSPGISIVESGGTTATTEGSTTQDSYTVVLTKAPTASVDVLVNGGSQSLLSKSGTPNAASIILNFTPSTWSTPQTVYVLSVNDTAAELRHLAPVAHTVAAGGAAEYLALPPLPSVTHIITDNDNSVAGNVVRITESSGFTSVTESATTDTFTVVLSQQPTSPVTLTFAPDSQMAISPTTLTFVPGATGAGTFNVAQTVTVRAVDDAILEPVLHWGQITATASSEDAFFNGMSVTPVNSSVYDNDGPRVTITPSEGSTILTENGRSDTYQIVLSHQPVADVVVTVSPDAQVTASSAALTFTNGNWNTPQTVTVTAVNDTDAETASHNGVVSHVVASVDPLFHNLSAARLTAQIWDNDSAGLNVTHAGADPGSTVIKEGGSGDAILVKLNTQPPAGTSVTITLYPPAYYVPPPQHGKTAGYFVNDLGGSNQKDNIVIDYTESILKYRQTFYDSLRAANGGTIPATPSTVHVQNAHWAASKAVVDQMDLWFCSGSLKARYPALIEPNQPAPSPLPPINPRQTIIEAIYAHSGGSSLPATTRYEAEIPFNPKSPSTTTFANDVRDRVRWAGYLMTVAAPGLISH